MFLRSGARDEINRSEQEKGNLLTFDKEFVDQIWQ